MVVKRLTKALDNRASWYILLVVVGGFVPLSCASAAHGDVLEFDGTLAGQPVGESSPTNPIELHHQQITELSLTMTNVGLEPVTVAHVRLEGELLDLIFLTYDTGVSETLNAGDQRTISFPIDFFDLEGQAHGLLQGRIELFDADRTSLGGRDLVIDGRGSPFATTSVFNLVLLGAAAIGLGWNLYRLSERKLPANEFVRGLRFVPGGVAAGMALSVACSTLRIWPLPTMVWLLITIVAGMGSFALGYFSPGSDDLVVPSREVVIDLEQQATVRAVRMVRPGYPAGGILEPDQPTESQH